MKHPLPLLAAALCLLVAPARAERITLPGGAEVSRDVPYVTDGHMRQRLDIAVPPGGGKHPLVVWIHGGAPTSIYATTRDGVTARGMPQWGAVLGARAVQGAVAYVLSIRDTNVSGRAPEGEPYDPSATATITPAPPVP